MIGTNARVPGWGPARCTHWRVVDNVTWWRMERPGHARPMCVWRSCEQMDDLPAMPPPLHDRPAGPGERPPRERLRMDRGGLFNQCARHHTYAPGKWRLFPVSSRHDEQAGNYLLTGRLERGPLPNAYRLTTRGRHAVRVRQMVARIFRRRLGRMLRHKVPRQIVEAMERGEAYGARRLDSLISHLKSAMFPASQWTGAEHAGNQAMLNAYYALERALMMDQGTSGFAMAIFDTWSDVVRYIEAAERAAAERERWLARYREKVEQLEAAQVNGDGIQVREYGPLLSTQQREAHNDAL